MQVNVNGMDEDEEEDEEEEEEEEEDEERLQQHDGGGRKEGGAARKGGGEPFPKDAERFTEALLHLDCECGRSHFSMDRVSKHVPGWCRWWCSMNNQAKHHTRLLLIRGVLWKKSKEELDQAKRVRLQYALYPFGDLCAKSFWSLLVGGRGRCLLLLTNRICHLPHPPLCVRPRHVHFFLAYCASPLFKYL